MVAWRVWRAAGKMLTRLVASILHRFLLYFRHLTLQVDECITLLRPRPQNWRMYHTFDASASRFAADPHPSQIRARSDPDPIQSDSDPIQIRSRSEPGSIQIRSRSRGYQLRSIQIHQNMSRSDQIQVKIGLFTWHLAESGNKNISKYVFLAIDCL